VVATWRGGGRRRRGGLSDVLFVCNLFCGAAVHMQKGREGEEGKKDRRQRAYHLLFSMCTFAYSTRTSTTSERIRKEEKGRKKKGDSTFFLPPFYAKCYSLLLARREKRRREGKRKEGRLVISNLLRYASLSIVLPLVDRGHGVEGRGKR